MALKQGYDHGNTPRDRAKKAMIQGACLLGIGLLATLGTWIILEVVWIITPYWPQATFENALTGEKFKHYEDVPFGPIKELFLYPNEKAERAWDSGEADAAANSMLYLILSPQHVTVILDDPNTAEMRSMLASIQMSLAIDILNIYAEAA